MITNSDQNPGLCLKCIQAQKANMQTQQLIILREYTSHCIIEKKEIVTINSLKYDSPAAAAVVLIVRHKCIKASTSLSINDNYGESQRLS